jgi:hypothetical protein
MALRIRYPTDSSLGFSIDGVSDGTLLDFNSSALPASSPTLIATLPEDSGIFFCRYRRTLSPTPPTRFTNGDYVVTIDRTNKVGYTPAPTGLASIMCNSGVNARQAVSPIAAASAGVIVHAGTGTIVIKPGNVSVTRTAASTDNAGNRNSVSLRLPL